MMLLQSRTRRWLLLMGVIVAAAACNDTVAPRQQQRDMTVPVDPTKLIVDGAHGGGNSNVFWLFPMVVPPVNAPGFGDPFDAGEPVEFWICAFSAPQPQSSTCIDGAGGNLIKKFSSSDVQVSTQLQDYHALWNTANPELNPNLVYRIEARIGSQRVALADVKLITSLRQLLNLNTNQYIPLPDDWTLPIRIRIEQGWNCQNKNSCVTQIVSASSTTPTLVTTNDGRAAALFPPGTLPAGVDHVVVTIEDVSASLTAGETCKNPTGPMLTTMVVSPQCFKFTADPKITFQKPVTVATCVDVVPERSTDDPLFHTEQLIKYDVGEQTVFLQNTTPPITCPPENPSIGSSRSSNSLMDYALATLSRVGHAVGQFFTPKSAYALHLGVGGIISGGEDGLGGGFSYITAGFPITESIVTGDGQTGTVNSPLAQGLKVLITSAHFHTVPVPNEQVRCDVTAGGGSLGTLGVTTATVTTGSDGTATCPTLILGPNPVLNSVKATALNIDDGVLAAEEGDGLSIQTLRGAVTFNATATAGTLGFVSVTMTDGQTPFNGSALTIEGPIVNFIATIQNPGSALGTANSAVILQNWVQQGNTRRAAGGTVLTCASQGVLPNGTCVQNWGASANDIQASGTGTFTAGSATLTLELWQGSVGDGTLLATKSIPITLTGASQVPGTLQGTVHDATGAAIPNVTVQAFFGDSSPFTAQTNADGFYQITQLPPTVYSVSISVSGFNAPSQQATVTPGGTTTVNFTPTSNP